jgi:hypothetical protein
LLLRLRRGLILQRLVQVEAADAKQQAVVEVAPV